MRRVVGGNHVNCAVEQACQQRLLVILVTKRRIHLEAPQVLQVILTQQQIVRSSFAGDVDSLRLRLTNQRDGFLRADVADVVAAAGFAAEGNVAFNGLPFAFGRNARNAVRLCERAVMNRAACGNPAHVLAVRRNDAVRRLALLHGFAHRLGGFDPASVVGEAAHAPAQRRHVGQFALALLPHRDGRVRTHINNRFALNQRFLHCQMLRAVRRRIQIRHRADGRISAVRTCRAAGRNGLLIRKSRLTQMHMYIHKAGKKGKSTAIKHFLCRKGKLFPTGDNDAVFNCHIGLLPLALFQDRTVLEQHSHVQPSCRFGLSVQL